MTESTTPAPPTGPELALAEAVREIEQHVASDGWDQAGRLYSLVDTAAFVAAQPGVASLMGIRVGDQPSFTPIEQEDLPPGASVESVLQDIEWPDAVQGAVAVLERLVLPPSADAEIPEDAAAAQEFARNHPDAQEVRMVAGATRSGLTHCVLRLRSQDDDLSVIDGTALVPGLLELLLSTLDAPLDRLRDGAASQPQTQASTASTPAAPAVQEETP